MNRTLGKLIKVGVGPKVLFATFKDSKLQIEEYSDAGALSAIPEETTITCNHSDTLSGGEHFMIYSPLSNFYVWFAKDNVGDDPKIQYATGLKVNIYTNDDSAAVASAVAAALDGTSAFSATASGAEVAIVNVLGGEVPPPKDISTLFAIEVTVEGERMMLFDGTLGTDIAQVLDVVVGADGSAEIAVLEKRIRKTSRGTTYDLVTQYIPNYITLPAGSLFV